jgi:alanyl-tRNA synthetase
LNNEDNLRFDFSHFAKMTAEEIAQVESIVNEKIRENVPVVIQTLPKEEALKLGAMALFGEKYGDVVRVVIMDPNYSVELCGGTHVGSTGELGLFKITSESAIAAGVRRVEAICGEKAEQYVNEQSQLLQSLREALKNPKDLLRAVEQLQQEYADLKKHAETLEARQLANLRDELLTKEESVNGVHFIGAAVEVGTADALKKLCNDLKLPARDHAVVLTTVIGGKPYVAIGIADNLVTAKGLDAGKLIKEQVAPLIKGGGGGQKTLATAGGQEAAQLPAVINKIKSLL